MLRRRKREGEEGSGEEIEIGNIIGLRGGRDKKLGVLGKRKKVKLLMVVWFLDLEIPFVLSARGNKPSHNSQITGAR